MIDEITIKDIQLFSKPQALRLWDVFFLGPFLIYAGTRKSGFHPIVKKGLIISGVMTMAYNGSNYILNEKRKASGTVVTKGPRPLLPRTPGGAYYE